MPAAGHTALSCHPISPQPTCGHRQHALGDVHRRIGLLDAAEALNQAQLKAATSDHLEESCHSSVAIAVKLQQEVQAGGMRQLELQVLPYTTSMTRAAAASVAVKLRRAADGCARQICCYASSQHQ